ncbi:IS3 family transposase [SAR92 clade bacterium H455]|uniref:IS3 family transposase n=1 Tax=SAR92 clade bacterium H455 TaxID=2974818 RepID=A0ABY5TNI9_9GAMM|nr:IS3 family transposase [SAR92 clade bacterium H455]
MCRVLKLHRSGFYAWLQKPVSDRAVEDQRLLRLIKESYMASGGTYGSQWIHRDLREASESCSVHRVARVMRENRLKVQIGYKRRYIKGGKPAIIAANVLDRQFNPEHPNQAWVSDITYGVPGVQGKHGCLNEPRVYLKFTSDRQELVCL